jgi:hypothetical protein
MLKSMWPSLGLVLAIVSVWAILAISLALALGRVFAAGRARRLFVPSLTRGELVPPRRSHAPRSRVRPERGRVRFIPCGPASDVRLFGVNRRRGRAMGSGQPKMSTTIASKRAGSRSSCTSLYLHTPAHGAHSAVTPAEGRMHRCTVRVVEP